MKTRQFYLSATLLILSAASAYAACPTNPSCNQLSQCAPHETFKIPFNTIRNCINQGIEPPREWKRLMGRGAVNTGGSMGNVSIGALVNPYKPPRDIEPATSGVSDFALNFIPKRGGSGSQCAGHVDPDTQSPNTMRGDKVPVNALPALPCGAAVKIEPGRISLTANATRVAIINRNIHRIDFYNITGSNLVYSNSSNLPTHYCEIEYDSDGNIIYIPVRFSFLDHYVLMNSNTSAIALEPLFDPADIAKITTVESTDNFVIATRSGSGFSAPPNCSLSNVMFRKIHQIPPQVGEINLLGMRSGGAAVDSFTPIANDKTTCQHHLQYFDSKSYQFIIPPDKTATAGTINRTGNYSATTILGRDDVMATNDEGTLYYAGTRLAVGSAPFYLGNRLNNYNDQMFLGGAQLIIDSGRVLNLSAPGRVKLNSAYQMQLLDGGEIHDNVGNVLNVIAPNGFVQFTPNRVIQGALSGGIPADGRTVLPTNLTNEAVLPYDVSLDSNCKP